MDVVITKEFAIKAVLLGACRLPIVGMKVSECSQSDLIWAHEKNLCSPKELEEKTGSKVPIWALGSGSGSGYGYGLVTKALELIN